jgi:hypothetical protein
VGGAYRCGGGELGCGAGLDGRWYCVLVLELPREGAELRAPPPPEPELVDGDEREPPDEPPPPPEVPGLPPRCGMADEARIRTAPRARGNFERPMRSAMVGS